MENNGNTFIIKHFLFLKNLKKKITSCIVDDGELNGLDV